jgi:hypothetical protein
MHCLEVALLALLELAGSEKGEILSVYHCVSEGKVTSGKIIMTVMEKEHMLVNIKEN